MSLMKPSEQKRLQTDFYVEGYATTFNDPYMLFEIEGNKYFEVIDRGALDGADVSDVIMQLDHQGRVRARTSNRTLGIEPDDHGLFTFADLSRSSAARELYEDITSGLITQMSWAFTVDKDEYDKSNRTRVIKRIRKVYDVSAVSIPANPGTEISARSYFDGVIEAERQELARRQRELELTKAKYFYMGVN
jgi:HK97 family phage prohead protease